MEAVWIAKFLHADNEEFDIQASLGTHDRKYIFLRCGSSVLYTKHPVFLVFFFFFFFFFYLSQKDCIHLVDFLPLLQRRQLL